MSHMSALLVIVVATLVALLTRPFWAGLAGPKGVV
jgi:hypothetical protein